MWDVNVSRDGRFVVVAYGNGTIQWRRLGDGQEVLTLFVNAKDREWVLWTPEGYYDSSVTGDKQMGWYLNRGRDKEAQFVEAAQMHERFHQPRVVRRALVLADSRRAMDEARLPGTASAALQQRPPPQIAIVGGPRDGSSVNTSSVALGIEITDNGEPVQRLDVTVNGRRVAVSGHGLGRPNPGGVSQTLDIPLENGENKISIVAWNGVDQSKALELTLHCRGEAGLVAGKGTLFILAIGVDRYTGLGEEHQLRYASADAKTVVSTLKHRSAPLYADVKVTTLASVDADAPTRENIERALSFFRLSRPEDTVILFMAGHGVDEENQYLFLPEDAQQHGDAWRPSSVLKWEVLQTALQEAQGRRIMFVDTCHSGNRVDFSRFRKNVINDAIIVFSATDEKTLAQEHPDLGHGVFSHALIEGLEGKAKSNGSKNTISIMELGVFVSNEVKRLTAGAQQPAYFLSGVDFEIARP